MDIVTIDFETYYDQAYSLSKITTEAYVRDPRFEIIGVAVKVNDHPTDWYSGDNTERFLKSLDYRDKAILCHNTVFDGAILSWRFGIKPRLWLDTLSMSRPLHRVTVGGSLKALTEHYGIGAKGDTVIRAIGKRRADFSSEELAEYAAYCCNDVDLTYKLFAFMSQVIPPKELLVIDQTIRLYTEPAFEVDVDLLQTHLVKVRSAKADLITDMGLGSATEEEVKKTLMSAEKFGAYLRSLGVEPPVKISPSTGKEMYAFSKTDAEFTALLDHDDSRVASATAARLGVKSTIQETRTQGFIEAGQRGSLPIMLHYYGAHTGRFSGGDKLNLQNLPRGSVLRRALCAPKGKVIIACDSAQIEARVVAWLAGQTDLVTAFAEGRDVYSEFASEIYGRKISKETDKVERFVGKTCILGLGYGMGSEKFRGTLAIGQGGISVKLDEIEAKKIVNLYRAKNHKIVSLWQQCGGALRDILTGKSRPIGNGVVEAGPSGVKLPNGLHIQYPALTEHPLQGFSYIADARAYRNQASAVRTKIYGGKVTENIVQALARIVVAEQMVVIGRKYKVALQVHDEIVCVVAEDEAEAAYALITKVMSTPPAWAPDLPIACEAASGFNYGDCK